MKKEIISNGKGINLIIMFVTGSTLVMGTGGQSGSDGWISILVAAVLVFPVLMMYSKILSYYPGKDLFYIVNTVFGKKIGTLFSLCFIWFAVFLCSLIVRNLGEYLTAISLTSTPLVVLLIAGTIINIWGVKSGIEVLGRWANISVLALIMLIIITVPLLFPILDFKNIRPLFYNGYAPIFKEAFAAFTFPFAELIIFTLVFSSFSKHTSPYKLFKHGLFWGGSIVFIITLFEILALGEMGYKTSLFPSFTTAYRIKVGSLIQRIEIVVSISLMYGEFIKGCMCFLGACRGIATVIESNDYRFVVTPLGLVILNLSYIIFTDIQDYFRWAFEIWRYYAIVFQVFLPVIILLSIMIKNRKKHIKN